MNKKEIINYQNYTILPVDELAKSENSYNVLLVKTPHKGSVLIELGKVDRGIFRKATELMKEVEDVAKQLAVLEQEAMEYLVKEWMIKNKYYKYL